jgi:hypothetical protein
VEKERLLCPLCSEMLELASGDEPFCLEELCPARSLVQGMQGPMHDEVALSLAAFMVARIECLGWPIPDYILAMTKDFASACRLAKALGGFLDRPVIAISPFTVFCYRLFRKKLIGAPQEENNFLIVGLFGKEEKEIPFFLLPKNTQFLSVLKN